MSTLPPQYAEFGHSVATVDIDRWVLQTLELWLPTYLGHVATERSLDYEIAAPVSYANVIEQAEWPDHALPAVLVATARTEGSTEVMADGSYTATWLVAVSALVRGQGPSDTRTLASLSELAIRMALVQHPSLGGYANHCRWVSGGQTRPVNDPTGAGRYLGEGASVFNVQTDGAVQEGTGPVVPNLDYEPLPGIGGSGP